MKRFEGIINKKNVANIIDDNMMAYSSEIIRNRVIPDVRDGLKPVHRKILITMNNMKAVNFMKSANVEGQVMKLHPHAGSYETMVGLVQIDNLLTPLIDGKGNFSQYTSRDLAPAAPRYSEVKLSDISKDIFKDLNRSIVNWIPNYDGTLIMPEVLPTKFPMILHIPQEGIAVGMSNKMASFSINDICNGIIEMLTTGNKPILVPDFATKGLIVKDEAAFSRINNEGRGTVRLRGLAEIEKDGITITEMPYGATREKVIETIINLVKDKKIQGINKVTDITGLKQMGIKIGCKRGADKEKILQKLYQATDLETTYSCNMNVLVNGLPKVLGVWDIVEEWLKWRNESLIAKTKSEIEDIRKELHLIEGFEIAIGNLEGLIKIIRLSGDVIGDLMSDFDLSEIQAEHIYNMKLRNINKVHIENRILRKEELIRDAKEKENFVESDEIRKAYIIEDLNTMMKNFGTERKTKIIEVDRAVSPRVEVENYNVTLFVTEEGYVKKVKNPSGEHKLKDGDKIIEEFKTENAGELIVFIGVEAHKIQIADLKLVRNGEMGEYLPNMVETNDKVIGYTVSDSKVKFYMIHYTEGRVAKIDSESLKTTTKRKKLANSICENLEVIKIYTMYEDVELELVHNRGMKKVISTANMDTKKSRSTQGIVVWKNLKKLSVNSPKN